jgi:(1->4)-alpha-D-glucan 1-alpha-D-glucosylmutase
VSTERLSAVGRGQATPRVPRATYRLQLQPEFGFDDATAIADYLEALGVSHVYSSPYLQAAAGSTHGYDVVDPRRVNAELGGPVAHQRFNTTLGERHLGQVLDIVPNHMAIGGSDNPYWWDVLENGPSSRYARFFDVEWDSIDPEFRNTVLLPVLGDHYGRVLEAGDLKLERDRGSFVVRYADRTFPVAPRSLERLLADAGRAGTSDELAVIGEELAALPEAKSGDRETRIRRDRAKEVLKLQLARLMADRPELAAAVDAEVERVNNDVERLDQLIEAQNYRLAFWRAAHEDLDYRRFFDVTTLAGLRTEDERVFTETHELVLGWLRDGTLDGIRIDHPDGLRDPKTYFDRLRAAARDAWIVAEKILEPGEDLPRDWPIAGTTGYDFLNIVNRLFTDPYGEQPLTQLYADFTGETRTFAEVAYESKRQIVADVLAAEVNRLTGYLAAVVHGHRRQRDYSRSQMRAALRELIVCFPVYRTYVRAEAGAVSDMDVRHVTDACSEAVRRRPDLDRELVEFIADVLLLRVGGEPESEFVMRFQQLTGPVMAKGVEDTAFYRYFRLASANEVGGDPGIFSTSIADFHALNDQAQRDWPGRMLASSTHDTKRSEDVRARMALLSEMPDRWRAEVYAWREATAGFRAPQVDANTEYLVYQTLVGAWPITAARLWAYVEKAVREQKTNTTWTDPDEEYEKALRAFVHKLVVDKPFVARIEAFVASLSPAWQISALAQTLLKLTAPGAPDIYQGTEIWDLSLVDPDNRRPVDYVTRRKLLEQTRAATAADALAGIDDGLAKIWLISRVLALRARRPEMFGVDAAYRGLIADGEKAQHVVSFARGDDAIVLAPRLVSHIGWPDADWADTTLTLPRGWWRDELSGSQFEGGTNRIDDLLADFPMAVLVREEGHSTR